MSTWIDTRWDGQHGIGRYAREVFARLTVDTSPLPLSGSPSSGRNAMAKVPKGLIYSPGFTAFGRAERQILTMHDLIHLGTPWPGRAKYLAYYNAVTRPVIRRTGVVITVSETSRRAIAAWLKDPSVEIVNAGIGVSEAFTPSVEPADVDAPYVMYVGNLREHKNLHTVLQALGRLADARLRAVLPPAEHAAARSLCADLGIANQVELLSGLHDDELARQYRGAAATVMPSTLEGFGLPPLESIMTGTPVIYWAGCDAVAETVGNAGWVVEDAHSAVEWADRIEDALRGGRRIDPPTRAYSWDATAATVNATIERFA